MNGTKVTGNKPGSGAEGLVAFMVAGASIVPLYMLYGCVLSDLWRWFASPMGSIGAEWPRASRRQTTPAFHRGNSCAGAWQAPA